MLSSRGGNFATTPGGDDLPASSPPIATVVVDGQRDESQRMPPASYSIYSNTVASLRRGFMENSAKVSAEMFGKQTGLRLNCNLRVRIRVMAKLTRVANSPRKDSSWGSFRAPESKQKPSKQ